MFKMKDDERRLLGAAQESGEFVLLPDISEDRSNVVLKTWVQRGLVDADSGRLTHKGRAARGGIKPQAEPVPIVDEVDEPVELPPIPQETFIGSPLLDDNELESDGDE